MRKVKIAIIVAVLVLGAAVLGKESIFRVDTSWGSRGTTFAMHQEQGMTLFMTAWHVSRGHEVHIYAAGHKMHMLPLRYLARVSDIAVHYTCISGWDTMSPGEWEGPLLQTAYTIGYPYGMGPILTQGMYQGETNGLDTYTIDVGPGNSGGPVIQCIGGPETCRAVGVVVRQREHLMFAEPYQKMQKALNNAKKVIKSQNITCNSR